MRASGNNGARDMMYVHTAPARSVLGFPVTDQDNTQSSSAQHT